MVLPSTVPGPTESAAPRAAAPRPASPDLGALRTALQTSGIDVLRVLYADVLGSIRSKDLLVSQLGRISHGGPAFCQGVWVTTVGGDVLDGDGIYSSGLTDFIARIAPSTWRPMPWEPGVAYVVAGGANPDGSPNELAPRTLLERIVAEYAAEGLVPIVGPELEFYLAEALPDGGWRRALQRTGRVYTTGAEVDPDGTFLHLLRMIDRMGIDAFAGNHEFSPGQYEINLWHGPALDAADRALLLKAAVKDMVARTGRVATFMGKPWGDEGGSGFHLHISVVGADGGLRMADGPGADAGLAPVTRSMVAGILDHARALTALCDPTVTAFKRLGPDTLAPYRANWGHDNRSALIRVPPERGAGTRLEVRLGDGGANPYLVTAALLAAGLDGIRRGLDAPEPVTGISYEDDSAPVLPMDLGSALDALAGDAGLRAALGGPLLDVFEVMKRDELTRYHTEVDDPSTRDVTLWEQREYLVDY